MDKHKIDEIIRNMRSDEGFQEWYKKNGKPMSDIYKTMHEDVRELTKRYIGSDPKEALFNAYLLSNIFSELSEALNVFIEHVYGAPRELTEQAVDTTRSIIRNKAEIVAKQLGNPTFDN